MTPKVKRPPAPKAVPADWEKRWIRWSRREMRRSEKQLLREKGKP